MSDLHRTLAKQLRRLGVDPASAPGPDGWSGLLEVVSGTYAEADDERYTLERSLEVSTREMRGLHEALSQRALQDVLTGLPNRAALLAHLEVLLRRGRSTGGTTALFIDLDGFKRVNDVLGHAAGDELLVRAAERISACVRPSDLVARLGGDEFVVVCEGAVPAEASAVADRILAQLCTPFRVDGHDAVVSASIGLATADAEQADAEALLRRADLAMYDAKVAGKARTSVFDAGMQSDADSRLSVGTALGEALRRGELGLEFQPQVRLADERVVGAEALVRWDRPGHGLLPAAAFVPLAEESALVVEVDRWVVGEAVRRAAAWCRSGRTLSVNASSRSLEGDALVEALSTALHRWDVPARAVELDVSEAALGRCSAAADLTLERLRDLGVGLAVDDVGTGSTSLVRLHGTRARTIKVDGSLVADVDVDAASGGVVRAVVALAHALGAGVVAEGVERRSQAEVLRELGCDGAQGLLFGSPWEDPALAAGPAPVREHATATP